MLKFEFSKKNLIEINFKDEPQLVVSYWAATIIAVLVIVTVILF